MEAVPKQLTAYDLGPNHLCDTVARARFPSTRKEKKKRPNPGCVQVPTYRWRDVS